MEDWDALLQLRDQHPFDSLHSVFCVLCDPGNEVGPSEPRKFKVAQSGFRGLPQVTPQSDFLT